METPSVLTSSEHDTLEFCERRIAAGIESFRDVGLALKSIRDARLYRATHATFEDYCRERWSFTKSHGNNLILAAVTIELLPEDLATVVAKSAKATRELSKVEPEKREEVVKEAAKSGKVTAKAIREASGQEIATPEDDDSRAYRVSLKLKALADSAKEAIGTLNPTRAELVQAALTFKRLAADLERAASQLPEDA